MLEKMTLISKLIQEPFALYQEQSCIYEKGIDDAAVLTSFAKNFGRNTEKKTLFVHFFRGLLFFRLPFQNHHQNFLLITILPEKATTSWIEEDWSAYYMKLTAAAAILSDETRYQVKAVQSDKLSPRTTSLNQHQTSYQEDSHDFVDNYQLEKIFINQLKSNDLIALNKILQSLTKINRTPLSNDKMQEKKYRLVSLITLLTRGAIKFGCSPNIAYRLSDQMIQKLDMLQTEKDINVFLSAMVNEFYLLTQTRSARYDSEVVNKACEYIYRNLYEKITNSAIANEADVHPSYLSSVFKKITGTSLRQFIIDARIDEAKYLLSYTELPFKEISERLHFSNQSYFGKLFKEKTTYTPKEFRILF